MTKDVVLTHITPFLLLRDYRSLRVVSKTLRNEFARHPVYKLYKNLVDTHQFTCEYTGCINRQFLSEVVDPFIDTGVDQFMPQTRNTLEIMFYLIMFPIYCVPFYRILYAFARQHFLVDNKESGKSAVASYKYVQTWFGWRKPTVRSMNYCICQQDLNQLRTHQHKDCTHDLFCMTTSEGGCVHCILKTFQYKSIMHDIPSISDFSFGVYLTIHIPLLPLCAVLFSPLAILFLPV